MRRPAAGGRQRAVAAAGSALFFLLAPGVVGLAFGLFVHWYEEPALRRQFGAEYEAYIRAVPAWWPRLRPWGGGRDVS